MKSTLNFVPPLEASPATESVASLYQRYSKDEPELKIRPSFQRNSVWNRRQQSLLIDSILRGAPVPEIYRQTETDDDGREVFTIVDGQQRITACLQYLENEFSLPEEEEYDKSWQGKFFADLSSELKKRFRSFRFTVREIPERVSEEQLREIFRRLNTTVVSLNDAELRNAAYRNEFTRLTQKVADTDVLNDISIFSANDYRRKKSEEYVAEIFDALDRNGFPNKKEGLASLYEKMDGLSAQGTISSNLEPLARRAGRALRFMRPLADDLRKTRFRNKSDFYSLFVFLAARAEQLCVEDRAAAADLLESLRGFSRAVTEARRIGPDQEDGGNFEENASAAVKKYTRSVERAASDRLNRLRRDEALVEVLGPHLGDRICPLSEADDVRKWPSPDADEDE